MHRETGLSLTLATTSDLRETSRPALRREPQQATLGIRLGTQRVPARLWVGVSEASPGCEEGAPARPPLQARQGRL